jgi:hypothetical protein
MNIDKKISAYAYMALMNRGVASCTYNGYYPFERSEIEDLKEKGRLDIAATLTHEGVTHYVNSPCYGCLFVKVEGENIFMFIPLAPENQFIERTKVVREGFDFEPELIPMDKFIAGDF